MPTERLTMRKIKELLRLKHGMGLSLRQIAHSCSISTGAVHDYLQRFGARQKVPTLRSSKVTHRAAP